MSRMHWVVGMLVLSIALIPAVGLAAEHGGQEHGGQTAAPAGAQEHGGTGGATSAPAAPAAATQPAPTAESSTPPPPPALKPITITFSGEVSALDTGAAPAMLAVQDRFGVKKEIALPAEAKFSPEGKSSADLKQGDRVTVEYTYDVATGKRTAQVITFGEAAPQGAGQ